MKIRIISVLLGAMGILLCLQSASGGRAANGGMDRTSAPGSGGACGGYCHSSAGLHPNTQFSIVAKDANNNVVTTYIPGQIYTIECMVISDGSPSGYGMQAVVLDSLDLNAGDLLVASTSQTQLTTITNGREFIEHQGISSTGIFRSTWMAPSVGTGPVTLYGVGIAVNGDGGTNGDDLAAAVPLVLSEGITSATNRIAEQVNLYTIFPNPSQGTFYLKNEGGEQQLSIRVLNIAGQVTYEESVNIARNETHRISLLNKTIGVHWVEVDNGSTKKCYPIHVL